MEFLHALLARSQLC